VKLQQAAGSRGLRSCSSVQLLSCPKTMKATRLCCPGGGSRSECQTRTRTQLLPSICGPPTA
jgi:hypothetical protein